MIKRLGAKLSPELRTTIAQILVVTGVILFGFSGWQWWSRVYSNPERVFTEMLENSLATPSVTRHIVQKGQAGSIDQLTQLNLGQQNFARTITTVKQGTQSGESAVTTESIGVPKVDFTRYIGVDTKEKKADGQPLDFSTVLGLWAKTDASPDVQKAELRYFTEALMGIIPIANLPSKQRQELLNIMKDQKVFDVDYSQVQRGREHGRPIIGYQVVIKPESYVPMLRTFAASLGLDAIRGLEQSNFDKVQPLRVQMGVDVLSRQLTHVSYLDNGRQETYSGYGLKSSLQLPTQTVSVEELQGKLKALR